MTVIQKDAMGKKYVLGAGAVKYYFDDIHGLDEHLRRLAIENRKPGHPAWNVLLDARKELEESNARSEH